MVMTLHCFMLLPQEHYQWQANMAQQEHMARSQCSPPPQDLKLTVPATTGMPLLVATAAWYQAGGPRLAVGTSTPRLRNGRTQTLMCHIIMRATTAKDSTK